MQEEIHPIQTLKEKAIVDNWVMKTLKVNHLRHVLAHTDKGDFCLMLEKGGTKENYRFVLDAVPVTDEVNTKLLKVFNGILFTD